MHYMNRLSYNPLVQFPQCSQDLTTSHTETPQISVEALYEPLAGLVRALDIGSACIGTLEATHVPDCMQNLTAKSLSILGKAENLSYTSNLLVQTLRCTHFSVQPIPI